MLLQNEGRGLKGQNLFVIRIKIRSVIPTGWIFSCCRKHRRINSVRHSPFQTNLLRFFGGTNEIDVSVLIEIYSARPISQ